MSYSDPYVICDTDGVLINNFGLRDADKLREMEITIRSKKCRQKVSNFVISIDGLRICHRHLLGEIYPWAGYFIYENIKINKDEYIGPLNVTLYSHDMVKSRKQADDLRPVFESCFHEITNQCRIVKWGDTKEFLRMARTISIQLMKDHPFRDGNTMTLHLFIRELGRVLGINYDPGYGCSHQVCDEFLQKWSRATKYSIEYGRHEYIESILKNNIHQSPQMIERLLRFFTKM